MNKIVTIIAGDDSGGPTAKAIMVMDEEDITGKNIAEMRTGVLGYYKTAFEKEAESIIVMTDDHVHDFLIPAYVARVAGTDHAESAHDTLVKAAGKALETEMTVLVAVTPQRHS
jgi:hypothetical protein